MELNIPQFATKDAQIDWLIANKSALVAQKKATYKKADSVSSVVLAVIGTHEHETIKVATAQTISPDATQIKVRSIINTTYWYDSHGDVHIDQLWNKSLKETKENYLVQEHNFSFGGIVSDNVKAFTKQIPWVELGVAAEGTTQALIFDSIIDKEGSPSVGNGYTMFDMYRLGKVKNHSVGMRYVELDLAVKDDRYEKENAVWNKYINDIANKEEAIAAGYFWAVTQAKVIEGSGVVRGSNRVTPTQNVTQLKEDSQPEKSTEQQPMKVTVNWRELANNYQPNF